MWSEQESLALFLVELSLSRSATDIEADGCFASELVCEEEAIVGTAPVFREGAIVGTVLVSWEGAIAGTAGSICGTGTFSNVFARVSFSCKNIKFVKK